MSLAVIKIDEDTDEGTVREFLEQLKPGIDIALRGRLKNPVSDLSDSIDVSLVGTHTIRIDSSAPHAKVLDTGSRARIMWNLINRVVPIKQSGGATIYRKVSLKGILQGKWRYPGTRGLYFVEQGAEIARQRVSGQISFQIVRNPAVVEVI